MFQGGWEDDAADAGGSMRRAAKVDGNHAEIVQALRRVGASVCDASRLGDGAPDLLVGLRGVAYLLEVKTPRGRVLASQADFMASWRGHYAIVRSVDEALAVVGAR